MRSTPVRRPKIAPVISITVRARIDHDPRQRRRHRTRNHQVDPRLHDPGLKPRSLRVADSRRSGQCAQDHSCHGLRARSRAPRRRQQYRGGGGDDHRDPRRRASHRVPGRSRQQRAEDHAHHHAITDRCGNQNHDQVAASRRGRYTVDRARDAFTRLAESYVWFNPHLTLRGTWHGKEFINVAATNPTWEKWGPRNPTSAHWYDETRLQRYLAAHVARDRDLGRHRTVREFIAEFRGLSGTAVQRKVLEEVGCSHQSLAQFFGVEQVNRARHRQAAGVDAQAHQAGRPETSRHHRRGSSQATFPGRRRQRRDVQISTAQGHDRAKASRTSSSLRSVCINPV